MPQELKAVALTEFQVAADGSSVRLNVIDADGNPAAFSLPSSCLSDLLLSLPILARQAHRAQFNDDSLKVVFPLDNWQLEAAESGTMMLTLKTQEGFETTFGLTDRQVGSLGEMLIERERGMAGALN